MSEAYLEIDHIKIDMHKRSSDWEPGEFSTAGFQECKSLYLI